MFVDRSSEQATQGIEAGAREALGMSGTMSLRVRHRLSGWERLRLGLAAVAAASLTLAAPATALRALDCVGIPISGGCLFANTGGDTLDPNDGYAVTNADGVPMWDFVRDRDAEAIGYPISQRWLDGPFTLQAFQKVMLQWDPANGRMNYYNTLDVLANRYPHIELPNLPAHQVLAADAGADFETVKRNHLEILDENPAIKARFLGESDWLNLYGLPIRYEEREVDGNPQGLQLLRAQRAVFAIWNVPAPGTTPGEVVLQNLPDKLKQLSNVVVPDATEAPLTPEQLSAFEPQQIYRRSDDDGDRSDDDESAAYDPPGTDNDGFDTTANTDHDGYDTTANTDHDGFDTTGNTDRDGFDTTGNTDRDGFDTTANTDHDGFDTTGNTDRDGFDTTANTDRDGFDTTGNTDRDGFDTTANTDRDGFDTTGNTDRDGFDTTANTDRDGFDTTGNEEGQTDDTDDTDDSD